MLAAPAVASVFLPNALSAAVVIGTLTKRPQFLAVKERGGEVAAKGLILQFLAQEDPLDCARFGYTVSGRVGNAVVRNRIRRRLRAVVREVSSREKNPVQPGYDYVVIGRKATLDRPYEGLVKDLVYALHQVKGSGGQEL